LDTLVIAKLAPKVFLKLIHYFRNNRFTGRQFMHGAHASEAFVAICKPQVIGYTSPPTFMSNQHKA